MLLEFSVGLGCFVAGMTITLIAIAFDRTVVRLTKDRVLIDREYYEVMKKALGAKGHMMVMREMAVRGRIPATDVKEEEDDDDED